MAFSRKSLKCVKARTHDEMKFCFGLKGPVKSDQEWTTANCLKDLSLSPSMFGRLGFLDNRSFLENFHGK